MLIKEVILIANSFSGLKNFYVDVLGLLMLEEKKNRISFVVGSSILTFIESKEYQLPYYHFAFNITENKRERALLLLKSKFVKINQINGQDEYFDESWNCHSIYFYDPLGNIVEFIARHNLLDKGYGDFSANDIKNISEIGIPVDNVSLASETLQRKYSVDIYKSSNAVFAPLGNEEGLFIVSGLNRKWAGSDKEVKVFPLVVDIYSSVERIDQFLNYPYTIKETLLN